MTEITGRRRLTRDAGGDGVRSQDCAHATSSRRIASPALLTQQWHPIYRRRLDSPIRLAQQRHSVRHCARRLAIVAIVAGLATAVSFVRADESIVNTVHNLSATGPGKIRAIDESRICIFCHTPHNASPQAPLWNRTNPQTHYRIYRSSTTDARIDQPGGASKMCLSCHDGSVAIGLVLSRDASDPIKMTQQFMPSGTTNLTNDLSDDHPVGFRYDRQLFNRDHQLRSPDVISRDIKLGDRGELECVACHDPHNNEHGDFLRIPQRRGVLCVTCHRMDGWQLSSHANSPKTVPMVVTNGVQLPFQTMADNACNTCHAPHNAQERERLLRAEPFQLCISCHDGITARDMTGVLNSRSGHYFRRHRHIHDPAENPLSMVPHVTCTDCHNPHSVASNPTNALQRTVTFDPILPPAMSNMSGVTLAGTITDHATRYYEVCFRCHADNTVPVTGRIIRQRDSVGNIRREILPTSASAHPMTFAARHSTEVPSLLPSARAKLVIGCQDCHNNPDARQLGGTGPNGPHGSRFPFLLVAQYDTADFSMESPQTYALCYGCHDRTSILNNESFEFHQRHIVNARTPCSACHAPHGVSGSPSEHGHLINFDISIVGGQRRYTDTGRFRGSCTLTCHGVNHVNFTYGTP